jgi:hypothetical protein
MESPPSDQAGGAATIPGGAMASIVAAPRLDPVNFKRQIDGQLVTLIEDKLGQKKGQEFDRCFIQGQIAGHVHMLATLEVARTQASAQLKPVLDDAVNVAQKHLQHAESLLSKLEPQQAAQ